MHQQHGEPLAGPATPTKEAAARHVTAVPLPQEKIIKEVDVEPKRRVLRQISSKFAATKAPGAEDGEDWLSKVIEHLWPKIAKVIEDMAWEMVPRKLASS